MVGSPLPGGFSGLLGRAVSQLIPAASNSGQPAAPGAIPAAFQPDPLSTALNAVFGEFGIDASVVGKVVGPSIVLYKVKPGPGVKAERVTGVSGNLNLALRTKQWRMLDVIEGEPYMGIEVPRLDREIVALPTLLAGMLNDPRVLLVPIGVDVKGRPVLVDLAELPHLLIGGTTGAGKSELLKAILCAVLARVTPTQVQLLLVDPKRVELSAFAQVPHLVRPVVTDPEEAVEALEWLVSEMDRRFRLFAAAGVPNIDGYNEIVDVPLPRLLAVVDELADLIDVAGKEVEAAIVRLGQLARAAGIHLVLATQRPSVDVVTGRIKANIVARLALLCASLADSRVVLDRAGAEKLLGRGDALWAPTGAEPVRVQCPLVSSSEVRMVVNRAMSFAAQSASRAVRIVQPVSPAGPSGADPEDERELLALAAGVVIKAQVGSTNQLQSSLGLGNAKARRLMSGLERVGVVGPQPDERKPRPVLMPADSTDAVVASIRSGEMR